VGRSRSPQPRSRLRFGNISMTLQDSRYGDAAAAQQLADADPAGGRIVRVPGLTRCARMNGSLPEPPGSIARAVSRRMYRTRMKQLHHFPRISSSFFSGVGACLLLSACLPHPLLPSPEATAVDSVPQTAAAIMPADTTIAPSPTSVQALAPEWSDTLLSRLPPGDYIGILSPAPGDHSVFPVSILSLVSGNGELAGTLAKASIQEPRLSPRAERIAYTRPGVGGVCIHTFSSGDTVCGTTQRFVSSPTWSPDSSFILAVAGHLIASISPATGEIVASVPCQALLDLDRPVEWPDCFNASISSDGTWAAVAYAEGSNAPAQPSPTGIYVFPLDCLGPSSCSQAPRKISGLYSDYFAWAPQGDAMAVGRSIILNVTGVPEVKDYPTAYYDNGLMVWSPDARYLASTAGSSDGYSLMVTDLSTGQTRTLIQLPQSFDLTFWATVRGNPSTGQ